MSRISLVLQHVLVRSYKVFLKSLFKSIQSRETIGHLFVIINFNRIRY